MMLAQNGFPCGSKWCIRQVGCDFSRSGALHGALVRAGEVAMTLRVRALSEEEAPRLARMTRSQKLGAGLVRRAQSLPFASWTLDRLVAYLGEKGIGMKRSRVSEVLL